MTYQPRYTPPARSAAECLWLWPTVVLRAAPGQDRDFALRIEQQALRPGWEATTLQLDLMRRMVTARRWANSTNAPISKPGGRYFAQRQELLAWLRAR